MASTVARDSVSGSIAAGALYEATKPGITRLVTITSALGFGLAALALPMDARRLVLGALAATVGTGLAAAGANALNQWMEHVRDARMPRTARRPLPSGRATPPQVAAMGCVLSVLGVGCAAVACGVVPAALIAFTILSYLLLYTPSKPMTWTSTWIGAVPGAMPPVIGWACADPHWSGLANPVPWTLFAIMFVWQIPHFLAIAWMYRADYAAGGYRVLPVLDPSGRFTSAAMLAFAGLLIPVSVSPAFFSAEMVGWVSVPVALGTSAVFAAMAIGLARTRTTASARRLFFASIIHLPVLLAAVVLDAGVAALLGG
ncbi:MAG: heme o synthase [Planctomycetota bacterium]